MGFTRKYLSADGLMKIIRHDLNRKNFEAITRCSYSWADCIMSGLAVFGLKMPSLLQFEKEKVKKPIELNLRNLYGIENVPSDTCMRERLDLIARVKESL
jgi:hypothetical protein